MKSTLTIFLLVLAIAIAGCSDESDQSLAPATEATSTSRCPKNVPRSESFDTSELLGLTLAKARIEARKFRCEVRPVSVDGRKLANVQDTRDDRVNVALEKARIVRIVGVY